MVHYTGIVSEIRLEEDKKTSARIKLSGGSAPEAGQYLQAHNPAEQDEALAVSVFPSQIEESQKNGGSFWAAPTLPATWGPGTQLQLRGPLGRGFQLPAGVRRLGLVAFGDTAARLQPLMDTGLEHGAAVALFSSSFPGSLPEDVEAHPLSSAPEALAWADFLAVDIPIQDLASLYSTLKITSETTILCPVQILVHAPMPCAGIADCGVCALPAKRGYHLVCKDGPVFDIKELGV